MSWKDPNQFASWDKLELGPHKLPGVARAAADCMRALELQKSNASDGAPINDNGYKNAPIDVVVTYLSEDHAKMKEIVDAIHPRTQGKFRAPLSIKLEQVNFLGINQVELESISHPKLNSNGTASVTFKFLEFVKDKPKPPPRPAVTARPSLPALPLFDPFAPSGIAAIEAGFASTEGF